MTLVLFVGISIVAGILPMILMIMGGFACGKSVNLSPNLTAACLVFGVGCALINLATGIIQ